MRYVPAPELPRSCMAVATARHRHEPLAGLFRDTARRVTRDLLDLVPGAELVGPSTV